MIFNNKKFIFKHLFINNHKLKEEYFIHNNKKEGIYKKYWNNMKCE